MTKSSRIEALAKLGDWMQNLDEQTLTFVQSLYYKNPWYTSENVFKQLTVIGQSLAKDKLSSWVENYEATNTNKSVGLVLAGNLPLVGFHDILSTLIMGYSAMIKVSSDDAGLTTCILNKLIEIEPSFKSKIDLVERLADFDLVIATGSNNSARYFEHYFGKKPNIIRKNRNSLAIIHGDESPEELAELGKDIFDYFGLGCRSVSKIFIPKDYNIATFYEAIECYKAIQDHYKYNNNYDYNKSIYLINGDKHFDNGFLLLKEDTNLASPLAVVFYEEYDNIVELTKRLEGVKETIQCIVSTKLIDTSIPSFPLGQSQSPTLSDYADGINTLDFLNNNI